MKKILSVVAFVLAAGTAQAQQQSQCAPRENMIRFLVEEFTEHRVGQGMTQNNLLMEVWANLTTGTWSITITDASGVMCMAGSGGLYETLREGPTF